MILAQICVGSSCYIKGSEKIIELFQQAITDNNIEDDISLSGSFCTGLCNREGVTITLNDEVYTGITPETFKQFFEEKILKRIMLERI